MKVKSQLANKEKIVEFSRDFVDTMYATTGSAMSDFFVDKHVRKIGGRS
jgi:hypothetical protein